MGTVRPAAVAGTFYPAAAVALRTEVDRCLTGRAAAERSNDAAAPSPPADLPRAPKMLLVPHAGYVYSGAIAGAAYALLAPWRGRIRRVVLLGPTHRVPVRGLAAPTVQAFVTPLGAVPLDRDALAALAGLPQVMASDAVHADEHALEVQLPFLQRSLDAFTLVPLAVGNAAPGQVQEVLERLWGGDETLIVISSDLSHYLPYAEARLRDRATIDRVLALDPTLDHHDACGATPLAGALLAARRHGLRARLVDLRNSGDTAGDRRRVVGYGAVVFESPVEAASGGSGDDIAQGTDADLGPALIARARNTIARALGVAGSAQPAHPALARHGATFVTLQVDGKLHGCIGSLHAERSLDEDVRHNAAAAAFDDPRFAPLTRAEYDALRVEVSLLDEPEPLRATDEAHLLRLLRPHIDGLVLDWRGRRATFLPQVWDELPSAADFVRALKRKAGLARDFWAPDITLARYRVRKFSEAS